MSLAVIPGLFVNFFPKKVNTTPLRIIEATMVAVSIKEVRAFMANQHVVPRDGNWAVRGAGNSRDTSVHGTQGAAIHAARAVAQNQAAEVVIHGRDGKIRDSDSYGRDPNPPRDRKH